jgi:glycosyltransferase involved in cell wall biosynthesis
MSSAPKRIKILHVITGLNAGGAERMLINVACGLDPGRFESHVICLSRVYPLAPVLRAAGIALTTLDAHPLRSLGVGPLWGVARALRRDKPDIVQTWLFDADLVGGLAGRMADVPVIWNVRASMSDSGWRPLAQSLRQRVVARVCEALSSLVPHKIITCSNANVTRSMRRYRQEKIRVIRNGVDTETFKPDLIARAEVRAELGAGPETPLIGMAARFDPVKDHATFLAAARSVIETHPQVRFVLCGAGVERENAALTRMIQSHGMERFVLRLGYRDDVARIFAALDLHLFSSRSESFGNVLMEAMASGVPCVSTDVGEARAMIGDAGRIVPRRNSAALAAAARELLDLPVAAMKALRLRARARICEHFTLQSTIAQYEALYENIARA